jgi:hypothetical protein
MNQVVEIHLLSEALSRARMPGPRREGPRPARQIAAAARHAYASQLGNRR